MVAIMIGNSISIRTDRYKNGNSDLDYFHDSSATEVLQTMSKLPHTRVVSQIFFSQSAVIFKRESASFLVCAMGAIVMPRS